MKKIKVSSLPFKDVLNDIAEALEISVSESCSEFSLELPKNIGEGSIKGINFDTGLGILIYDCTFSLDFEICFSVDKVHPLKYIYALEGEVNHSFERETNSHKIETYKSAIVASSEHHGHILNFKANQKTTIVSLEIDRKVFKERMLCEMSNLNAQLKDLFLDVEASKKFYHAGHYSLRFQELFEALDKFEEKRLVRKMFLEGKASEIFVNQILDFEDDIKADADKTILRKSEIEAIKKATSFIHENIKDPITIKMLSRKVGLNPNKLQEGFKYLYKSSINEYLNDYRMTLAMQYLKNTEKSISEICYAIGLSSRSYFSKTFKNRYNILPSAIRKTD
ncbi:transcriptional regulator, AraC family [Salegentibacter echinorum]|uniref:Transcriptional regulator, AraC family n=1 Tax=Salegentibacter echinorum TaxID=1073325 RepID=A0A1M5CTL6_SALEC|nr:AraC family transcriptional regulator [Salegentibacter echinorum]SHF58061.1 transcriptional regulator, AraC family [Salegentibacter echinorum]